LRGEGDLVGSRGHDCEASVSQADGGHLACVQEEVDGACEDGAQGERGDFRGVDGGEGEEESKRKAVDLTSILCLVGDWERCFVRGEEAYGLSSQKHSLRRCTILKANSHDRDQGPSDETWPTAGLIADPATNYTTCCVTSTLKSLYENSEVAKAYL
jgi:hypothetical protein